MSPQPKMVETVPEPVTAELLGVPGIAHGFFTRAGGVSKGIHAGLNVGLGSAGSPGRSSPGAARSEQPASRAGSRTAPMTATTAPGRLRGASMPPVCGIGPHQACHVPGG